MQKSSKNRAYRTKNSRGDPDPSKNSPDIGLKINAPHHPDPFYTAYSAEYI